MTHMGLAPEPGVLLVIRAVPLRRSYREQYEEARGWRRQGDGEAKTSGLADEAERG